MRASGFIPIVSLAILVMGAGLARAAVRVVVVSCASNATAEKAAVTVGHTLREAFRRDERYDVVDLETALGSPKREHALHTLQAAEDLAQDGRDAYDALSFAAAAQTLTEVLHKYEEDAAYVTDAKRVANVLMVLGAVHMMQHQDQEAVHRLEEAIAMHPTLDVDWRNFSPVVHKEYQEVAKRMAKGPRGSLHISATPEAVEVQLDGNFVGVTPLTLNTVLPGRHFVRLQQDGYQAGGGVVDVQAEGPGAIFKTTLVPTTRWESFHSALQSACASPNGAALQALATAAGAKAVALARTQVEGSNARLSMALLGEADNSEVAVRTRTFANDGKADTFTTEAGSLFHTLVGGNAAGQAVAQAPAGQPPEPLCVWGLQCRAIKTLTLGIVGGVGVVALGVGIGEYVVAHSDNNQFRSTAQLGPGQPSLRNSGRSAALAGDILVFGGGALCATAAVLWRFWQPTPVDEHATDVTWQILPQRDGAVVTSGWAF